MNETNKTFSKSFRKNLNIDHVIDAALRYETFFYHFDFSLNITHWSIWLDVSKYRERNIWNLEMNFFDIVTVC